MKIEQDTPYNKYVDSKIVDVCLSDLDHPTVSNALKDILCQPEINPASELFRVHQHLENSQQSCIDVNDLNTPDMSFEVLDLLEFKKSLQSLDVVGVGKQRSGGMCS